MKKYLLFFGHVYYPEGGVSDLESFHDSEEEARAHFESINPNKYKWAHIALLDGENLTKIREWGFLSGWYDPND